MSVWLALALALIVGGGLKILSRLKLVGIAAGFWLTFAAGVAVLAAAGHQMTAPWHLGPIAGFDLWWLLVTSPEILVFLFFMITDPRTIPETARGGRIYAISVGLVACLLIAPWTTEFAAKLAVLGALTVVCVARPPLLLLGAGRRLDAFAARVRAAPRAALVGAECSRPRVAAVALVAAELPSRMPEAVAAPIVTGRAPQVTVERSEGLATMDEATARRIAASLVADLSHSADALRERDRTMAREGATGTWLADLWQRIDAARGATIDVPTYDAAHVRLRLEPGTGQGPPVVVATLTGTTQSTTYDHVGGTPVRRGQPQQVVRTFELDSTGGRYLVSAIRGAPAAAPTATEQASFSLKDVAASVGLDFRQGSFRYGTDSGDVTAMMGGGLCWLDYDGDGWLDLYVVNSYSQADAARWNAAGGLPQSRLYHNVHGRFEDVTAKTHTGLTLRGSGCVAADFDGNGTTDLLVTAASYDPQRNAYDALLWNNGDGTFTEDAKAAGIDQPGWHTGAAAADVNGDGRLDLFVAGYTDVNHPIPGSEAGFPADHGADRDLLYLNEGGKGEHPRFREVGRAAGLEPHGLDHGLGAVFTDVNGDGRPDLYVANDLDPNRLYVNEPASGAARLPLRRGGTEAARRRPQRGDGDRGRRLLGRRAPGPVRDELARPAPRRVPRTGGAPLRRRTAGLRRRARPAIHGLGGELGRPRPRRQPGARDRERRDPGHQPREGRAADPCRDDGRRHASARSTPDRPSRGTAGGSRSRTSTTTATPTSRSTRSVARCSCSATTARRGTGSRSAGSSRARSSPRPCPTAVASCGRSTPGRATSRRRIRGRASGSAGRHASASSSCGGRTARRRGCGTSQPTGW